MRVSDIQGHPGFTDLIQRWPSTTAIFFYKGDALTKEKLILRLEKLTLNTQRIPSRLPKYSIPSNSAVHTITRDFRSKYFNNITKTHLNKVRFLMKFFK